MKARWLSAKERAAAKVVAEQLMDKQADDIKTRAECLVYASMLNVGLSPATVNKVIQQQKEVEAGYAKAREDNLGDYALIQGLIDKGVHVNMTKEEI